MSPILTIRAMLSGRAETEVDTMVLAECKTISRRQAYIRAVDGKHGDDRVLIATRVIMLCRRKIPLKVRDTTLDLTLSERMQEERERFDREVREWEHLDTIPEMMRVTKVVPTPSPDERNDTERNIQQDEIMKHLIPSGMIVRGTQELPLAGIISLTERISDQPPPKEAIPSSDRHLPSSSKYKIIRGKDE